MTRRFFVALVLLASVGAPLRADLKYTTHSELKPSTVADSQPANPLFAMLGAQLIQQMLPNGTADTLYIIGDKGLRNEYIKGGMNQQPEGTVTLALANGDIIQLNAKEKTYWKTKAEAMTAAMQAVGIQPEVGVTPTSESTTILGVRTQRSNFDISIPLPIPEQARAQMPPGFPTSLTMSGEVWLATAPFEKYVSLMSRVNHVMAGMGLGKLMQGGIVMRQVMRSAMFNGQQLETMVTRIGEETVPASLFEIPADYKEVPAPVK